MLTKLKSRKFWTAMIGVIVGIAISFGVDAEAISQVAGAVTVLGSVMTYIYTEGKIDAAAVKKATDSVKELVVAVDEED